MIATGSTVGPVCWIDGRLLPVRDASVSILDRGLSVGDGAFETIAVHQGNPFALTRHLERLRGSLSGLGLSSNFSDAELREAIYALVGANGEYAGRVRLTVTAGLGALASDRTHGAPTTVVIGTTRAISYEGSTCVVRAPWSRNENDPLVGIKTLSYAGNIRALSYAHDHKAGEALFANTHNDVCEGTGSNVFVAFGDELVTPPLSSGCLPGITRALVLELMGATEVDIPWERLESASEAFLTSTTRNVQAIRQIDEHKLSLGPISTKAASALADLMQRRTDP